MVKWFILSAILFPLSFVFADTPLSIEEFVQTSLPLDVNYQAANLDAKAATLNKEAASSLWRRTFQFSPYQNRYSVAKPSLLKASEFAESGVQSSLLQGTPWGTNLEIGIDQSFENTRQSSPAKEQGLTLGLSQSLWKNQFGEIFKLQKHQADIQWEIAQKTLRWKKNEACLRVSGAFLNSYILSEKLRLARETLQRAEELKLKSEMAQKRGQMSQLEWLGVQSDYWNMKALQHGAEQDYLLSQLELQKYNPEIKAKTPQNPSAVFANIKSEVDKIVEPNESLEELIKEQQVQTTEIKLKEVKSNASPDLDFKVSKTWNQGHYDSNLYRDSQWGASIQLTWKFGDPSVDLPIHLTEIEKAKLDQELAQERRVHPIHFTAGKNDLQSMIRQMELAEERNQVLTRLEKENLKRFYQGRIEFQSYLRTKEQWQDSQKQNIEIKALYWKRLLEFSLDQNRELALCGGMQ